MYVVNTGVVSLRCHHCNEMVSGIHTAFTIVVIRVAVTTDATIL